MQNAEDSRRRIPPRGVIWGLTAVAAVHAALFVIGVLHPQAVLRFDRTGERLASAQTLLAAGSVEAGLDVLERRGTPGDYLWHVPMLAAMRGWLPGVQLFQLGLLALSLFALYRIAIRLDGRRQVAWTAVLLYALIPIDLMVPHFLASEAVFTPLLVTATALCVEYATRSPGWRPLGAAGILYGLAALTRPLVLGWLPLMLLVMASIARVRMGRRGWLHLAVLAGCTAAPPVLWMSFQAARTGSFGYGGSSHDLGSTLGLRVVEVRRAAGAAGAGDSAVAAARVADPQATLAVFLRTAAAYPLVFAKSWISHSVKFIVLPDNLDGLVYLGAFQRTGTRAALVHEVGWTGALRLLFREMPIPVLALLAGMLLFAVFWILALRGAWDALRSASGLVRQSWALLLSMPAAYLLARIVEEGSARKRAPIDFVLALCAALGIEAWHSWRARRRAARGHEARS